MSQLLDELRILIEDPNSEDFTDAKLQRYLDKYRIRLDDYPLTAETDERLVWRCNYQYLDSVTLDSASDTPVTDSYSSDDLNGIYTFTTEQTAVYIKAYAYDLYRSASDIWLVRAEASFSGKVKVGDEDIPMDKYNREYCIMKYWDLRQSSSTQGER